MSRAPVLPNAVASELPKCLLLPLLLLHLRTGGDETALAAFAGGVSLVPLLMAFLSFRLPRITIYNYKRQGLDLGKGLTRSLIPFC